MSLVAPVRSPLSLVVNCSCSDGMRPAVVPAAPRYHRKVISEPARPARVRLLLQVMP